MTPRDRAQADPLLDPHPSREREGGGGAGRGRGGAGLHNQWREAGRGESQCRVGQAPGRGEANVRAGRGEPQGGVGRASVLVGKGRGAPGGRARLFRLLRTRAAPSAPLHLSTSRNPVLGPRELGDQAGLIPGETKAQSRIGEVAEAGAGRAEGPRPLTGAGGTLY